jgi:D-serine deaminase-like pyridoxal phosphate-dependent protein
MSLSRRDFIGRFLAATAGASTALAAPPAGAAPAPTAWRNWSGALAATPRARVAPASEAELAAYLRRTTGPLRPVGSGHSFSPLVPTGGDLVVIDRLRGVIESDAANRSAWVHAGTRLSDLGPLLEAQGQAAENLPDIDRQTLAGALATATHGTGDFPSLAGYVDGLRIVTPAGEVRTIDGSEPDLLAAGAVSLGSLGVVTAARLNNRAPYHLRAHNGPERLDVLLEEFDARVREHRHFEFFPLPHSDWALALAIDEVPADTPVHNPLPTPEEDAALGDALELVLATPMLARRTVVNEIAQAIEGSEAVEASYRILCNIRNTRFNEASTSPSRWRCATWPRRTPGCPCSRAGRACPSPSTSSPSGTTGPTSIASRRSSRSTTDARTGARCTRCRRARCASAIPVSTTSAGCAPSSIRTGACSTTTCARRSTRERAGEGRAMKRRDLLVGGAAGMAVLGVGGAALLRPADVTRSHDAYFSDLNALLRREGPGHPVLVVDRARVRENVDVLARSVGPEKTYRVVVKSLPSVPLLREVMERARTRALMVFHQPFLNVVAEEFPDADVLLGKPMPVTAVRRFYAELGQGSGAFDAATQLQWLVDTPTRLEQYRRLARELGVHLRVNFELDVGLHRGGLPEPEVLLPLLARVAEDPQHLSFAGLMGYEPHLTGTTDAADPAARAVLDAYRGFVDVAREAGHDPAALTLNGAGSHTLRLYEGDTLLNDLSAGSGVVKPTDFDTALLAGNRPALFIATPILKRYDRLTAPVPELATDLMQWWDPNRRRLYFVYGGYWKARYVSPTNVPDALYHSTNQEPLSTSVSVDLEPDDHVFLRPTQSEFVMLQFGDLLVVDEGELVDRWPIFVPERRV